MRTRKLQFLKVWIYELIFGGIRVMRLEVLEGWTLSVRQLTLAVTRRMMRLLPVVPLR
jgi:hypothetical protein